MTRLQLDNLLKTLNVPVFYNHTTRKDNVSLPFLVYLDLSSNNLKTDNRVYFEITNYTIIIHSTERETTLETNLKTLLNQNRITYELNGVDWDEDLMFYQISYNIYPSPSNNYSL